MTQKTHAQEYNTHTQGAFEEQQKTNKAKRGREG